MKAIYIAGLCIVGTLLVSPSSFAESSELKQQILPMDCVFEVVDVGTGELRFLTPDECGQIITPPAPVPTPILTPSTSTTGDIPSLPISWGATYTPYWGLPDTSSDTTAVNNLDPISGFHSAEGHTAPVKAGQIYYFAVPTATQAATQVVQVHVDKIDVSQASVTFSITGRGSVTLSVGHQVGYDTDGNGRIDLVISVVNIADGSDAKVRFRFYETPLATTLITYASDPTWIIWIPSGVLSLFGAGYLLTTHKFWLWILRALRFLRIH